MIYPVDLTNDYATSIYAAARTLLANGALPADMIETYRNGKLSMSGNIGICAKLTVIENKNGRPSLSIRRWRPFAAVAGGTLGGHQAISGAI